MLKKQLFVTAVIFWICVLSINLMRPQVSGNTLLRFEYMSDKIYWKNQFDIVIAGDSRTLIGISPQAMQKILPGYNIGNLGFIALVYSQDYMNYIRNTLHSPVKNRIIVINFSPSSLLSHMKEVCDFRKLNKKAKIHPITELDKCSRWIKALFHELTNEDLKSVFRNDNSRYLMVYFKSGWMACRRFPEGAGLSNMQYKRRFAVNKIDINLIDLICRNTKAWTAEGIKVIGVRMPISPRLFVIEKKFSGFEEQDIRKKFEESGGIWLNPPVKNPVAYDGAHLRYDSAAAYSRSLAFELKKLLEQKP